MFRSCILTLLISTVTSYGKEPGQRQRELLTKHKQSVPISAFGGAPSGKVQEIIIGAGCFWGVELAFQRLPGVIMTEVGYAGGHAFNPSYAEVSSGNSGHAEVVRVVFDADQISLDALFDVFFEVHDPTSLNRQGGDVGTQCAYTP